MYNSPALPSMLHCRPGVPGVGAPPRMETEIGALEPVRRPIKSKLSSEVRVTVETTSPESLIMSAFGRVIETWDWMDEGSERARERPSITLQGQRGLKREGGERRRNAMNRGEYVILG